MSGFSYISNGDKQYDLGAVFSAAVHGHSLKGATGEMTRELELKHGSGIHVPLSSLVQVSKATGASAAIPGAVPLLAYQSEAGIAEIDNAIKAELLATKFGVSTRATAEAEFRIPYADARPSAVIVDVDQAIADQGNSNFDYVSIKPVIAGSKIEIANSLNFSNPDAVSFVSRQIVDVVRETIDNAFLNGYGPTAAGLSFGGLINVATPTGLTINIASTIAGWSDVKEFYSAYTKTTANSGQKWLMHPQAVDKTLSASPIFAGAMAAIGQTSGMNALMGDEIVKGRMPVVATNSDAIYGDPAEIFLVLFNSATINLTANPYEATAFAKGSTLLRVMMSFGMGVRDPRKLYQFIVQI